MKNNLQNNKALKRKLTGKILKNKCEKNLETIFMKVG